MSSTQEKLYKELDDEVHARTDAVSYGFIMGIVDDLIDSAKREELEEVKKDSIAISLHGSIGYDDVVLVEDIDNRIAQLQEQSGGEKNE